LRAELFILDPSAFTFPGAEKQPFSQACSASKFSNTVLAALVVRTIVRPVPSVERCRFEPGA
jgi:hypothetical protein